MNFIDWLPRQIDAVFDSLFNFQVLSLSNNFRQTFFVLSNGYTNTFEQYQYLYRIYFNTANKKYENESTFSEFFSETKIEKNCFKMSLQCWASDINSYFTLRFNTYNSYYNEAIFK